MNHKSNVSSDESKGDVGEATKRVSGPGEATDPLNPSLLISETFYSVQGEGKLTGVPSYFIRVSGCPLRCTWCDTPYTSWQPEGRQRSVSSLVAEASATPGRHVVLTGGEPMVFKAIESLCRSLHDRGMHITVETAGVANRDIACDLMSISPKLSNSTPMEGDHRDPSGVLRQRHEAKRLDCTALQGLIDGYPTRQFKFVVAQHTDLDEISALLAKLTGWTNDDILLMPEGVIAPPAETRSWVVAECLKRNWRYCSRLHIELFGNKRGT